MDDPAQLLTEAQLAALRVPDQAADVDDLVQETLLRVWQRMQARGETGVPGGLIRITLKRLRIDWWRKRRRLTTAQTDGASAHGPLDEVAVAELRAALRRALNRLPEVQREVVRLRIYEGRKFKEIAAMQQVPLNTVLGRMHLASKKLRSALASHLGEVPDA